MSASYQLLEEPWIPVVDLAGEKKLLGIRTLLEQAHLLREISDPSPLVEYGLYRLLVVFLMDALRPEDEYDLTDLLKAGQFPMETVEQYISTCQSEGVTFDLFDRERPFLQTPFNEAWDKQVKPASVLDYTVPSGNNHVHFDHRHSEEISFSYGQAARFLPAVQLFCTAGAQGYPSGMNGAPPYYAIIQGKNLFETLTNSLLLQADIQMGFDDPPVIWRSDLPVEPKKSVAQTSWLYGMLFPARRVLLIPEEESETVQQVYLSQGMNCMAAALWTDPHVAYRVNDKGRFPLRPNQEKAIWRNLHELTAPGSVPQIAEQYKQYIAAPGRSLLHVLLYGVQTDQASYIAVFRHDLQLPAAIIENAEASDLIREEIEWSEKLARALRSAITHFDIPPQTVSQAVQTYYDRCGRTLLDLCRTCLAEETANVNALYQDWVNQTSQYAVDALDGAMKSVLLRGRSLMEVSRRHGILFKEIQKKKKEMSI